MAEPVGLVCPGCQQPAKFALTGQAFCGNDDCKIIAWNPSKTFDELMDSNQVVDTPEGF